MDRAREIIVEQRTKVELLRASLLGIAHMDVCTRPGEELPADLMRLAS